MRKSFLICVSLAALAFFGAILFSHKIHGPSRDRSKQSAHRILSPIRTDTTIQKVEVSLDHLQGFNHKFELVYSPHPSGKTYYNMGDSFQFLTLYLDANKLKHWEWSTPLFGF